MNKTALLMLLIALGSICYASEDITDNQEYFRKKQELDLLAERFKAETGFEGTIEYNYNTMQLGSLRGTFSSVYISNKQDTLIIRQVFNTVLDEILPYTYATKNQLVATSISNNNMYARTEYIQFVNGYRIESGGLIGLSYNKDNGRFHVGNSTVDIPLEPLGSIISEEEALRITKNYHINDLGYPKEIDVNPATISIAYVEFNSLYELCYLLGIADPNPGRFMDYTIVIDATSGKVKALWNLMSP